MRDKVAKEVECQPDVKLEYSFLEPKTPLFGYMRPPGRGINWISVTWGPSLNHSMLTSGQ